MSSEYYLIGLSSVILLGIGAQWLAWRLRVPAILFLLLFGCLAGAGTEWLYPAGSTPGRFIDPDYLLGGMLLPLVSLSVAIILFEGGLTLNGADLARAGTVIFNLVSVGALMTWLVAALAGWAILGLPSEVALLLGAILSVTGPTVIGPLLRHIRPTGQLGPILRWEGIVIDPIGALLAVLVFEAIPRSGIENVTALVLLSVAKTVLIGSLLGLAAAGLLVLVLRRYWVPDVLESPVTLMLVVAAFAASNLVQPESGLFATTVMGIALANQRLVQVRRILEFKENLAVLLISSLFILLGARLTLAELRQLNWQALAFLAVLILLARPLAVLASTLRSGLNWRERIFLMCMAPRGIVAAAVSSVFALRLDRAQHEGGSLLVPYTFAVIIGTVVFYGLVAPWAGRLLGVSSARRRGFLIAGANPVARALAGAIQAEGHPVVLVDTNRANLAAARMSGLSVLYGSILSQQVVEQVELSGIGRLLAMTPNDEVNSLATQLYARIFGRSEVFQLSPGESDVGRNTKVPVEMRGRVLFGKGIFYRQLEEMLEGGASLRKASLTREYEYGKHLAAGGLVVPMLLIDEAKNVLLFTEDTPPAPRVGQAVVSLSRKGETPAADTAARLEGSG